MKIFDRKLIKYRDFWKNRDRNHKGNTLFKN